MGSGKKKGGSDNTTSTSSAGAPTCGHGATAAPVNPVQDFSQALNKLTDVPERPFPVAERCEPRVHVAPAVYDAIIAHSRENTAVELCGILVGAVARDALGPHLAIEACIRGVGTRNEGAQVTFTHDTWDHIHREMEQKHPGKRIVGWYHTHPGFGIFLSEYDKFIQDNFFDQPFQVAMVVDPIGNCDGMFAWIDGRIRALTRCWIGTTLRPLTQGGVGNEGLSSRAGEGGGPPNPQKGWGSSISLVKSGNENDRADKEPEGTMRLLFDGLERLDWLQIGLYAIVFVLGLFCSSFFMGEQLRQATRESAQAEARSILGMLGTSAAAQSELKLIEQRFAAAETAIGSVARSLPTAGESRGGTELRSPTTLPPAPTTTASTPTTEVASGSASTTAGVTPVATGAAAPSPISGPQTVTQLVTSLNDESAPATAAAVPAITPAPTIVSGIAGELAAIGRQLATDRAFVASLSQVAGEREQRLQKLLAGKANEAISVDEKISRFNAEIQLMHKQMAMVYFVFAQMTLPPEALQGQPVDPGRLKQAQYFISLAVTADPSIEAEIKQRWPQLYGGK